MGQVFSNIWSCLRQKLRDKPSNTTHNDQRGQEQQHQSYYITIPGADIHQIPSSKPARVTSTTPRNFTPPLPSSVIDFNNYAYQKQQRIAKKKEYVDKQVLPRHQHTHQQQQQQQQSHYIDIPDAHTPHFSDLRPFRVTTTSPRNFTGPVPSVVVDLNNHVYQNVPEERSIKTIGPYNNLQKILLVGEGNFSFSASFALAFGFASNIIATSLNSQEFLIANYGHFLKNKTNLETRGATIIHDINATTMVKDVVLGCLKFDRIIYSFPHTGSFGSTIADLRKNQELIRGFLKNAKKMINEDGEIHINHKCNGFFLKWDILKIGSDQGLRLTEEVQFNQTNYPGYHTKYGFGGDKNFDCNPSKTYKFALLPK